MTTDRIKNINNFIDSIITQDEWEDNFNKRFELLVNKYTIELEHYEYIKNTDIKNLKKGGYIKYINTNNELYFGGALVNITADYIYMIKDNDIIKINKFKNIIFYRNHRTYIDKVRDVFISSMEKYT